MRIQIITCILIDNSRVYEVRLFDSNFSLSPIQCSNEVQAIALQDRVVKAFAYESCEPLIIADPLIRRA